MWPLLSGNEDVTLRELLISRFARLGVEPMQLVQRLLQDTNVSVRRSLIRALGTYTADSLSPSDFETVVNHLLGLYQRDPDSGIHSASAWTLARWEQKAEIKRLRGELAASGISDRNWFVNGQGQTMVIVPPPDAPRRVAGSTVDLQLTHSFAIGAAEVTREQFARFRQHPTDDSLLTATLQKYAPHADCPAVFWRWFDVADYCNWLSLQEGIPPEEWCYTVNEDQRYEVGMRIAPDFVRRTGYRLPTKLEWEYACRTGVLNEYAFGDDASLLERYGWFEDNSASRTRSVCQQQPNEWGLFDMHGNVWEWGQDVYGGIPMDLADGEFVLNDTVLRHWHGGSYTRSAPHLRSGTRDGRQPSLRDMDLGFRVVRTLRDR